MFLAIVRTNLDDVPVGLFKTRPEAVAKLAALTIEEFSEIKKTLGILNAGIAAGAVVSFMANGTPLELVEAQLGPDLDPDYTLGDDDD